MAALTIDVVEVIAVSDVYGTDPDFIQVGTRIFRNSEVTDRTFEDTDG